MPTELSQLLLVEDDPGLAELIGDRLQRTGLRCDAVSSGHACLEWLATRSADLLILDYSLPDMTGAALLTELQQRTGKPQPFVVITGRGDEEVAVQFMKLGALDYLVKDTRLLGRLPDTITRLLKEIATQRRLASAEQALHESEQRYRHLLASITDYLYSVKLEGGRSVATSHGPGCITVTGYTPEDYAADPQLWLKMVHPDDRAEVEQYAHAATAGTLRRPIEHRILHRSGSLRWVQNRIVPRHNPEGQVVAFDGVVTDITERKQAETALRESESQLSAIYDHAPVMLLLIDRERRLRRLNCAAQDFAGRPMTEVVGGRAGDFIGCLHVADSAQGCGAGPACVDCQLRRVVDETMATGTAHHRVETQPRRLHGKVVHDVTVLVSTARVEIAGERLVLLCLEDVSQQRIAEQRVREQAALLDVTRDAIVVINLEGIVKYWNRGAELLFGWPAAEATGENFSKLIFPQPIPAEATGALETIRRKGEWTGELRQVTRRGEPILGLCRGVLVQSPSGEARSILFSVSDITEAKRLEAQFLRAQRLESLGSLAGGVAHDLNNVFTPIMMSGEMLRAIAREPHEKEMVQLLGDSARRGADIVRQLLLFGRGSDSPRTEVSVSLVIRELRRMMQETFPKNITLSVQAPADLWVVHGDPTQLHQVLLNLCVNARDAMPDGGWLTVTAQNVQVTEALAARQLRARPGPHLLLRVSDTGSGIAPEIMEKIFDPFFTTKPFGKGTGLGLATTLGIVRSHGGFITVTSKVAAGSDFGVYLPALPAGASVRVVDTLRQEKRGWGELVLILDDEPSIRHLMQRALRENGYEVVVAVNGQEAISVMTARGAQVRLVVTDVMMPVMDGIQIVQVLRRMNPDLPVVAVSGVASYRADLNKLPPPKIRFVSKPFSVDELLVAMRQAIENVPSVPSDPASPRAGN